MSYDGLHDRLASIEHDLAVIKAELARISITVRSNQSNWIDLMEGPMAEFPEFPEVVRLGREFRKAHQPPEESWE